MAEILRWSERGQEASPLAALRAALDAGGAVGLPTETEYSLVISARHPDAVAQLAARRPHYLALVVRDLADASHWLGSIPTVGKRLARRCWPGPLDLVFAAPQEGPFQSLPPAVQQLLASAGELTLTCPGHESVHLLLDHVDGPLVLGTLPAESPVETAAALQTLVGDEVKLIVDDGPTRYGRSTSAVRIQPPGWQISRPGVVPPELVERLACCLILFVCTGNTCRSPLAEALCKKLLADRLGCSPPALPSLGYLVESAGLSAMSGAPAAAEAVLTAQELGADLSQHRSQPVTPDMVIQADHVITMTHGHLRVITDYFRDLETPPRLLCPQGTDLPDPIGCGLPVYQECARLIRDNVEKLLSEIQPQ